MPRPRRTFKRTWRDVRRKFTPKPQLTGRNYEIASRLLLDVARLCDEHDIDYAIDSGTLLGIAREGDLIPWDNDLDITMPAASVKRFLEIVPQIAARGWRVSRIHTMQNDDLAWKKGATRSIKVRNHHFPRIRIGRGRITMDIFITYPHEEYVWWVMLGKVCRISAHHFAGHERLPFQGYDLRAPRDYETMLAHVFGENWRIPDRDYHPPTQDGSIVRGVYDRE